MPLVKYFLGEVYKLREFLTQIKIKITNKGPGLVLTGRVLEWFKSYFTKVQLNGLNTTNIKVRYIFLI